jgi:dTDP-4-amino-4,6-dideoxygalactose transaminase
VVSGVGAGDEVITTPITFASTANVIIHCGATPVFVDVEPGTLNIDPQKIEEKITKKTKAIIPVHFAGNACRIDEINEIARVHQLAVVEDAAHAIETRYDGKHIGTHGNMACFSFYATKNITTGEGGILTTDDDELAERIRILSLHGISKDAWKRYGLDGYRHWDILYPGYKYNMFDLQACLGVEQLKRIDGFLEKRALLVRMYDEAFQEIPEIKGMEIDARVGPAFYLYVVQFQTEGMTADRDTIMNAIQAENVGIGIHFRAIHLHPYYQKTFGFRRGMYPHAEYASDRVISLPLCPSMSQDDASDVIETVRKVTRYFSPKG